MICDTPVYEHSCEHCRYLGAWVGPSVQYPDRRVERMDLYACQPPGLTSERVSLLARFDDDAPEYLSRAVFSQSEADRMIAHYREHHAGDHPILEAWRRFAGE